MRNPALRKVISSRTTSSRETGSNSLPRLSAGALTPFGRKLRRLRFEHSKRIYDLARDLQVSSSSVSAWETGRREIDDAEIRKIGNVFSLTDEDLADLKEAAELSKNRVVIEPNSIEARQLANQIKKRINDLTSEAIQTIMKHLKWTAEGRNRWDMKVPKKTTQEIERVAHIVRKIACTPGTQTFDVVRFYEELLDPTFFHFLREDGQQTENTAFEIWDDSEMPKDTKGMTTLFPPHIVLANSVYEEAANEGHAGRWIMAHELGHLLLLHGITKKPAKSINTRGPTYLGPTSRDLAANVPFQPEEDIKLIPPNQSAEIQADDFAGELLMPRQFCRAMSDYHISLRYGVSTFNARKRLRYLFKRKVSLH